MKKIIPVLLTVFLLGHTAAGPAFTDIPPRHENLHAIEYVHHKNIVSGYDDGTYRPDDYINRAEFTKIIVGAIATDEEISGCNLDQLEYFDDVPRDSWYAPFVCLGFERGIIHGHLVTNGKPQFRPSNRINLVAASKIITVGFGIGESPMDCIGHKGADCAAAAAAGDIWYRRHIEAMAERNAIPLSFTSFQDSVTRGQMAEMVYRLHAGLNGEDSRTYEQLENPADPSVSPISEWKTYENKVVGYTVQYPESFGGMGSNTYGVGEPACVVSGRLGALDIRVDSTRSDYGLDSEYKNRYLPVHQRAMLSWEANKYDDNPHTLGKDTGALESFSEGFISGYKFWTTQSVTTFTGGFVIDEKYYVLHFDHGDDRYEMTFKAADEGIVNQMLRSWRFTDPEYVSDDLYGAATECQQKIQ